MTDTAKMEPNPRETEQGSTNATVNADSQVFSSILGDCHVQLVRATPYEPPLYLFPELLPRVPQGTAPQSVWDSLAHAVQVKSSYWKVADAAPLLSHWAQAEDNTAASAGPEEKQGAPEAAGTATNGATSTLAQLIAAGTLAGVGFPASVLEHGRFSASSILKELTILRRRLRLSEEQGEPLFSQHFINLLAWRALTEMNYAHTCITGSAAEATADASSSSWNFTRVTTVGVDTRPRKRPRSELTSDATAEETGPSQGNLLELLASPDPWDEAPLRDSARAGGFIAGHESNVEERIELLHTLAQLYRRPIRTLQSAGAQTDLVVPPGTMNPTTPYASPQRLPGSTLDVRQDLGWGTTDTEKAAAGESTVPSIYVHAAYVGSDTSHAASVRPVCIQLKTFGEHAFGVSDSGEFVTTPAHTRLALNLATLLPRGSAEGELISTHHCSLIVRATRPAATAAVDVDGAGVGAAPAPSFHARVTLLNYGGNGCRVDGVRWVLEEPYALQVGDRVIVGGCVALTVTAAPPPDEADNSNGAAKKEAPDGPALTPVKTETLVE